MILEKAISRGLERCARAGGFARAGKGSFLLGCDVMVDDCEKKLKSVTVSPSSKIKPRTVKGSSALKRAHCRNNVTPMASGMQP